MAFATTLGTTKYNIETVNQRNVILRYNGVEYAVKSDGAADEYVYPEAQFFVDSGSDGNNLLFRFRPVSQKTKYLAASGSRIVLKDVPNIMTISDNSHDFYVVSGNGGYSKYLYKNSPVDSALFMSTDSNDDVVLAGDSSNASFILRDSSTNASAFSLTASAPDYLVGEFEEFFKETNNGPLMNSIEIEEGFFSGKLIVSDRISVSEE